VNGFLRNKKPAYHQLLTGVWFLLNCSACCNRCPLAFHSSLVSCIMLSCSFRVHSPYVWNSSRSEVRRLNTIMNVTKLMTIAVTKNDARVALDGSTFTLGQSWVVMYCTEVITCMLKTAVTSDTGRNAIVTNVSKRILLFWFAASRASTTEDAEKSYVPAFSRRKYTRTILTPSLSPWISVRLRSIRSRTDSNFAVIPVTRACFHSSV